MIVAQHPESEINFALREKYIEAVAISDWIHTRQLQPSAGPPASDRIEKIRARLLARQADDNDRRVRQRLG